MDERFEAKTIAVPESGCWLWTAATNGRGAVKGAGYGNYYDPVRRRLMRAHRYAYERYVGPIPDGLHVLHKCDVSICVNPNHLYLGTNKQNMEDKSTRNRAPDQRGVRNPRALLSQEDIERAWALWKKGLSQEKVAAIFGVHQTTISHAFTGRRWPHIQNQLHNSEY